MKSVKNISYADVSAGDYDSLRHKLDIYCSGGGGEEVLVFIHGGSWSQGHKDLYSALGEIMAEKGIVTVLINYRLAPAVMYEEMAMDCASAVKWVHENIHKFGGNKEKIFLMGHSAGGHLSALITLNPEFFAKLGISNPVKGCILLDAFGLNIHTLLREHQTPYNYLLHQVFTDKAEEWERGSPANFITGNKVPFYVFAGDRTYPFIMLDNGMFVEKMEKAKGPLKWEVVSGKSHYQMIAQMENPNNKLYGKITDFMRSSSAENTEAA